MSTADYFMVTGAIYLSHELSRGFRAGMGLLSLLIGIGIQIMERL